MQNVNKKNQKRLNRLFDRDVLKFKLLDDELQISTEEDREGFVDLLFRIESFRQKLPKEKAQKLAKEFGLSVNTPSHLTADKSIDIEGGDANDAPVTISDKQNPGGWQKKLLRVIVKKTHPDKVTHYENSDKEFYTDVYRRATAAYHTGEPTRLMAAGHDVRIKPTPLKTEHLIIIKEKNDITSREINDVKKRHGFIWFNLTNKEKEVFLLNYMAQLGYTVPKEEVIEVVKRVRPKRKVGERPRNMLKTRVKGNLSS